MKHPNEKLSSIYNISLETLAGCLRLIADIKVVEGHDGVNGLIHYQRMNNILTVFGSIAKNKKGNIFRKIAMVIPCLFLRC